MIHEVADKKKCVCRDSAQLSTTNERYAPVGALSRDEVLRNGSGQDEATLCVASDLGILLRQVKEMAAHWRK
jgi:hypothetical protein